jgi:hypothetical protein
MVHTVENVTDDGLSLLEEEWAGSIMQELLPVLQLTAPVPIVSFLLSRSLLLLVSPPTNISSDDDKERDNDDKWNVDGAGVIVDLGCFSCCCSSCWSTDDEEVEEDGNSWVIIAVGGVYVRP